MKFYEIYPGNKNQKTWLFLDEIQVEGKRREWRSKIVTHYFAMAI